MTSALGWSRTTFTGAVTLQTIVTLFVAPIVGPLLDRYGPRVIMVFGATVAMVGYLLLGRVSEPWQFYLLYTAAASLGLNEVGNLVTSVTVSKWFVRMRGRALAMTSGGINVGQIVFAPFSAFLIVQLGWRAAWAVLGVVVAAVILPPAILLMRRTPEDMGLQPDGAPATPPSASPDPGAPQRSRPTEEPQWAVKDAVRTRTLWLIVISTNLGGLAYSGILYHLVAYYTDIGLSLEAATLMIALNHAIALLTKLPWGFLAERVPVRYCLMGTYLGRVGGLLFLLLGALPARVFGYVTISGSLSHSIGMLQSQIWADYYGRRSIGAIRGVIRPFSVFSAVGGPIFAAFVYDSLGSYNGAFWVFVVTLLLATIVIFFAIPSGTAPAVSQPPEEAAVVP